MSLRYHMWDNDIRISSLVAGWITVRQVLLRIADVGPMLLCCLAAGGVGCDDRHQDKWNATIYRVTCNL